MGQVFIFRESIICHLAGYIPTLATSEIRAECYSRRRQRQFLEIVHGSFRKAKAIAIGAVLAKALIESSLSPPRI